MTSAPVSSALVEKMWSRFKEVGFTPDFGPGGSQFLVAVYRRLASTGEPIPAEEALKIAAAAGMEPAEVLDMLEHSAERDEDGAVQGIVGFSLNEFAHSFTVGDNRLSTWCALDPLFIAPIIGRETLIESADPQTGEAVSVTVEGDEVTSHSPADAVVSIVIPKSDEAAESVEAVWMLFCDHVHFFASKASAEAHFAGKDAEVYFPSVAEAFELGSVAFAALHAAAR